jgi:hypothetical protein
MALTKVDPVHGIDLADKEYFHVDLTTAQTGVADITNTTVDFGGSGTVKYDTKSNFDSANDAYLLDSSDGVYLISYSIGLRTDDLADVHLIDTAALVRVATDGSTFVPIQGSGAVPRDDDSGEGASLTLSGTFIYKSTNATTKVDLQGFANLLASDTCEFSHNVNNLQNHSITGGDTARCTFLTIVRIA